MGDNWSDRQTATVWVIAGLIDIPVSVWLYRNYGLTAMLVWGMVAGWVILIAVTGLVVAVTPRKQP